MLVGGQDTLFHLPLTAQRSLSWLPGRWDSRLAFMEGGKDEFRAKLRDLAEEKIRKDPWIGTGYDVNLTAAQRLMLTMGNKFEALIMQMALGSSWHNRWLGYAADLGIPASILLAVIYLFVISRCHDDIATPSGRVAPSNNGNVCYDHNRYGRGFLSRQRT